MPVREHGAIYQHFRTRGHGPLLTCPNHSRGPGNSVHIGWQTWPLIVCPYTWTGLVHMVCMGSVMWLHLVHGQKRPMICKVHAHWMLTGSLPQTILLIGWTTEGHTSHHALGHAALFLCCVLTAILELSSTQVNMHYFPTIYIL